jgi:hypothetical protein
MKFTGISMKDITRWEKVFPDVDIVEQFKKMAVWLLQNEANRKSSKQNWSSFITRWLKKEQIKEVGL